MARPTAVHRRPVLAGPQLRRSSGSSTKRDPRDVSIPRPPDGWQTARNWDSREVVEHPRPSVVAGSSAGPTHKERLEGIVRARRLSDRRSRNAPRRLRIDLTTGLHSVIY